MIGEADHGSGGPEGPSWSFGAEAPRVGLSCVHIPSEATGAAESSNLHGTYRTSTERILCEPTAEVLTPLGPVAFPLGDSWGSIRRWRDGVSVGVGPVLDASRRRKRGEVAEFSRGSALRMRRYLQECSANYRYMGTLTVGRSWTDDPAAFRAAVDRWLGYALRSLRAAHLAAGLSAESASIFWFVEFQERGAPHLHIFYTLWMHWEPLARKWHDLCERFELCGRDETSFWKTSTRFETLRRGYRGTIAYATKYARKTEQKQVPENYPWRGRFWGVRGLRTRGSFHATFTGRDRVAPRLTELRTWLDQLHAQGLVRRWRWEHGDGACYAPVGGLQWSETPFGAALELRLARIALDVARE